MPKYKIWYLIPGFRHPKSIGTIFHNDDEEALADFRKRRAKGFPAELWRPDRKRLLARRDENGVTTLPASDV